MQIMWKNLIMNIQKIKVCPFCGKKPFYDIKNQTVHCETPECALGDFYIHITEWNTRYNEKPEIEWDKREIEKSLCRELETIFDSDSNIIQPLSYFWRYGNLLCPVDGHYGVWISYKNTIKGKLAFIFDDNDEIKSINPKLKEFLETNNLYLYNYDNDNVFILNKGETINED